jgi:hypothetical protein
MSTNRYTQEIVKTGFELEFRVSEVFRHLGWTVIANKYYIDDHQGTVREIDVVAYRTTKLQDYRLATVVVVSCKKNERDAWVLLSKDLDRPDPNMEWQPLHTWFKPEGAEAHAGEDGLACGLQRVARGKRGVL